MSRATLHIVGGGQLGRSLGRLWHAGGWLAPGEVVCRDPGHAAEAVGFIGAGRPVTRLEGGAPGDLYLLSVPDDRLAALAGGLAADAAGWTGSLVFHCSGALGSDLLAPLAARGALIASVHPLRSFADPARAVSGFAGTWCAMEGDVAALARLQPLFEAIGGRCVALRGAAKVHYHAAAVLASNYLVALLEAAQRLLESAGIDRRAALEMLAPLSRGTLDNLLEHGSAAALSGPILRGDTGTVARQLEALRPLGLDALYRALGRVALDLASARGHVDPGALEALRGILAEPPAAAPGP